MMMNGFNSLNEALCYENGYEEGQENERRRVLAYLDELKRNRFTHASVDKMIKFIEQSKCKKNDGKGTL